jgi:hypothetical protein
MSDLRCELTKSVTCMFRDKVLDRKRVEIELSFGGLNRASGISNDYEDANDNDNDNNGVFFRFGNKRVSKIENQIGLTYRRKIPSLSMKRMTNSENQPLTTRADT